MASTAFTDLEVPEGVDPRKAANLIKWLVRFEDENAKRSDKLNDSEMVQKIGKQIQGDVKCL